MSEKIPEGSPNGQEGKLKQMLLKQRLGIYEDNGLYVETYYKIYIKDVLTILDEVKADFPLYHLINTPEFTDSTAPSWFKNNHPAVKNYAQYIIKSEVDQKEVVVWFNKWWFSI